MGNFSAICFSVNNVTIVLEVAYSGLGQVRVMLFLCWQLARIVMFCCILFSDIVSLIFYDLAP